MTVAYKERLELANDAIALKETGRIPICLTPSALPYFLSGDTIYNASIENVKRENLEMMFETIRSYGKSS